jgi:hypothetical protein
MVEMVVSFLVGVVLASIFWGIKYFRMYTGFQNLWENERAGNVVLTNKLTAFEKERMDLGGKDDGRNRKKR